MRNYINRRNHGHFFKIRRIGTSSFHTYMNSSKVKKPPGILFYSFYTWKTLKEESQLIDQKKSRDLGNKMRKGLVEKGQRNSWSLRHIEKRSWKASWIMKHSTFLAKHESEILGSPRIFGSRFVEELKKVGDRLKKKISLVAQN